MFASSGCSPDIPFNDPTVVSYNKQQLSGPGEEIGVLPDGRKLVRYQVSMGRNNLGTYYHPHWVYVIDNSITINREIQEGKTTTNHVEVIVDGIFYKPVERE